MDQAGFLKPTTTDRFSKVRRGVWEATFELAVPNKQPARNTTEPVHRLADVLCRRGVSTATTVSLVATHAPTAIEQAVRAMDEQVRSGATIRSADSWIRAALKNGYNVSPAARRSARRPGLKLFRAQRKAG